MGNRCAICASMMTTSKLEEEVKSYIREELNINFVENDRTMIMNTDTGHNLELDIWIPEQMRAIEVNGDYWHSTKSARRRDFIKSNECRKKGVNLLIIKEHQWYSNKEQEKKRINAFFGG
jgi:hypothetical protein